ncbi:MAG TPA: OmpA family protein [Acetobacteraceae bacterium]|jgi:outer membrane protein OmpA-like peptidoglycan-associated protein
MRWTLLLTAILLATAVPACAQVTVDLHALDALPNHPQAPAPHMMRAPARIEAAARPAAPIPTPPAPVTPSAPSGVVTPSARPGATPVAPTASPPTATLPAAPPPVATIAPVAPPPAPANPAKPPPPPPVVATATTAAAKMPAGLQLTFASDASDLSPDSAAAIKQLVVTTPSGGDTTFNVLAYAAGAANDPSEPRRLSLARALAVRSALIADGVSSARIYVRALGAQGGSGPADRADIEVMGANAPAGAKSP